MQPLLSVTPSETYSGPCSKDCVKSVRIRSFSGQYFPVFGLHTERYSVSVRIQSQCRKIQTRKTPNTDTFNAVTSLMQDLEAAARRVSKNRCSWKFCKILRKRNLLESPLWLAGLNSITLWKRASGTDVFLCILRKNLRRSLLENSSGPLHIQILQN